VTDLVNGVLKGKRIDLARLITLIENGDSDVSDALSKLYSHTGNAHIIGVTGPPGSGKSSLVTKLTAEFRSQEKTIGIVCVDPSSPFTGGALLGDRIRMQELEEHFSETGFECKNIVWTEKSMFGVWEQEDTSEDFLEPRQTQ
jgi:putative protein kinase ArgK-like GTPase of G3E family